MRGEGTVILLVQMDSSYIQATVAVLLSGVLMRCSLYGTGVCGVVERSGAGSGPARVLGIARIRFAGPNPNTPCPQLQTNRTSTLSNFETLFDAALAKYSKRTGQDLHNHESRNPQEWSIDASLRI
jgi:hypothetical protein